MPAQAYPAAQFLFAKVCLSSSPPTAARPPVLCEGRRGLRGRLLGACRLSQDITGPLLNQRQQKQNGD